MLLTVVPGHSRSAPSSRCITIASLTVDFLGWLSIHGVTELGALVLFAAGGLVIAEKMLFPGRYSRIENLAMHGRLAAQMAVGAVLMLFVAAILEGGFRQLVAEHALALRRSDLASAFCGSFISAIAEERRAMTLAHERTTEFLEGTRRERRQIITPEGVPVTVELADYGERLIAFILDLFVWLLADARDLCPDLLGRSEQPGAA